MVTQAYASDSPHCYPLFLSIQRGHAQRNEAAQAWEDAKRFTKDGEYAKALERHVWYHAHARKIDPDHEMRLSFALGDWKELAEKYPPAREAIIDIREDDVTKLWKTADPQWFEDIAAIDRDFFRERDTIDLFKEIAKKKSDSLS